MAIIDLGTGAKERAENGPGQGRIIDLKTGQFVEDAPVEEAAPVEVVEQDSFAKNALDVAGEFAAGFNRTVLNGVDFLTVDQVNNILELAGSDKRLPTLGDAGQAIGATQGNFMEPGLARDVVAAAGETAPMALGLTQVPGRNVAQAGEAVKEIAGLGSAAVAQPLKTGAQIVSETLPALPLNKAQKAAELPLKRRSGDVAAAGFKLDDAGRVIKDKAQQNALKAGVDEGVVAMIAASNKATKSRYNDMLAFLEGGRKNLEFRNFNPPQRVLGQAIDDRLKIIQSANKQAANNLDAAANALKNKPVDVSPAINQFLDDLAGEGIRVDLNTGKLDFSDSTIEGLDGAQSIIKNVFKRLYHTKSPTRDAHKAHLAKRFIDEQVTYGKTQEGLSGRMEGIIKGLRHNIDASLDRAFPEYDRVNTIYKETRDIIDEVQTLAGRRVDLNAANTDKALGTMSRKILSNYNTGQAMETLFENMDVVAKRYSTPLSANIDDDLKKLVSMEAEIRRMFPSAIKPNTFQGEIGAEVARGAADAASGGKTAALRWASKQAGKLFSKDDEAKIQALKELFAE